MTFFEARSNKIVIRFNCTDEDVLAHLDYLKPPIVGLKKTRSIATIQYDCDFLVAINHFINNGFTRPDIMSSKVSFRTDFNLESISIKKTSLINDFR